MKDFEDALQCAAALQYQVDCIVTRNLPNYEACPTPAMTSDQFIERQLSAASCATSMTSPTANA
jgi:hypothetical protein